MSRPGNKFKKKVHRRSIKAGMVPGTLMFIGEKKTEDIRISLIKYNEEEIIEENIPSCDALFSKISKNHVNWINIDGIHDVKVLEKIGQYFQLHPLLMEDIPNTHQRPKIEEYENSVFYIIKMIYFLDKTVNTDFSVTAPSDGRDVNQGKNKSSDYTEYNDLNSDEEIGINDSILEFEQVSIIQVRNCVLTFQERPGDVLDPIRNRIREKKGRIRSMREDYLVYCICDVIVDHYFTILDILGEKIENLEDMLFTFPGKITVQTISDIKKKLLHFRKSIWPLRTMIAGIDRFNTLNINKETKFYYRDINDHLIFILDGIESFREMISSVFEIYLSTLSNKMNEIMKILTIISTVFIPLTFIAGVYGMNFAFMPELKWKIGYPLVMGIMAIITFLMFRFFKKKKWL